MSEHVDLLAWQIRATGLPAPISEYRFHPTRRWRFDLAWLGPHVALEVDGGTWVGGRHTSGQGYERDAEKLNHAAVLGWRVLRVTPAMIQSGQALAYVEAILGPLQG